MMRATSARLVCLTGGICDTQQRPRRAYPRRRVRAHAVTSAWRRLSASRGLHAGAAPARCWCTLPVSAAHHLPSLHDLPHLHPS